MKTLFTIALAFIFGLSGSNLLAQEASREKIEREVKEKLREALENLNEAVELEQLTAEEAAVQKEIIAKDFARQLEIRIDSINDRANEIEHQHHKKTKIYEREWFKRSDLLIAVGFNNAISENTSLDNSPYKFGGSRFFELGWVYKRKLSKTPNALSLKYGFSFQFNGLKPSDNLYFVQDSDQTYLDVFPLDLRKSKLTITNLVAPVHLEIGSSTSRFKLGLGGYGGFNIGTRQKLKYTRDGERVKDKIKKSYNASNLVYGLSAYCAFGDTAVYVKYDLNPLFKNQAVEQRNVSLGLRFDMY